jgi:predicted dehydrogenase
MNRRQFMVSTAALTAGALPLTAAAPRPKIKISFLGGAHSHALEKWKTVRALDEYEPVGLCEESPQLREPFLKLGAKVLSREELFERCEVIAVESAVRDHARDARLALKAGKHVHVEKAPAVTLSECNELVRLAREKKLLLQTGYMWRFHPGINRAVEAAQRGWLGEVFLVRGTINTLVDAKRRPEWAEFKGGTMFELGCHLIDAVVRVLGKPLKVTPHLQRRGGDDLADNCVTVFEFAKAQAIVTSATIQPNAFAHRSFEILGTNGAARVQPIEPPTLTFDLAKAAGPYKTGAQQIELPAYRRYLPEFTELAASIRSGKPLSVSPDTELIVQETLLRACEML